MADTEQEMINKARLSAAMRAQVALMKLTGVGPPAPTPIGRPGIPAVVFADVLQAERERARQFAIRIFDEADPDMDEVARIVRKMRDRLSTPNFPTQVSGPNDPNCTVRQFGGYVVNNRPPVHLCRRFFSGPTDVAPGELQIDPDEQRTRTVIHETAHLVGIGEPNGESYYTAFDGCPFRANGLGPNAADSWAHFIHAVSGQPLDKAAVVISPGGQPPSVPAGPTVYTVVSGDYLVKIAQKFYGDGQKWRVIYNANKGVIGQDPNKIYPGQKFVIPNAP